MEKHKAKIHEFAQMKFFCYFELKKGCIIIGAIMATISVVSIIMSVVQTVGLKQCEGCAYNSWKYAVADSIAACIYSCLLLGVNLWFIWGVKKEKKSVVMAWVVISTIWLVQVVTICLVLMVEFFEADIAISWVILFVLMIFSFVLLTYFVLVGYGYWLRLKSKQTAPEIK